MVNKIKGYLGILLFLKMFFVDGVIATIFIVKVVPILGVAYAIATMFMLIVGYNTITKVNEFVSNSHDELMKTAIELGLIKQKKAEVDVID